MSSRRKGRRGQRRHYDPHKAAYLNQWSKEHPGQCCPVEPGTARGLSIALLLVPTIVSIGIGIVVSLAVVVGLVRVVDGLAALAVFICPIFTLFGTSFGLVLFFLGKCVWFPWSCSKEEEENGAEVVVEEETTTSSRNRVNHQPVGQEDFAIANTSGKSWTCSVCNIKMHVNNRKSHLGGKKHLGAVEAAQAAPGTESVMVVGGVIAGYAAPAPPSAPVMSMPDSQTGIVVGVPKQQLDAHPPSKIDGY